MTLSTQDSFFAEHIPQSEYRVTKRSKTGKRNRLDTDLPELPALSAEEKTELKNRILAECTHVITLLIPPSIAATLDVDSIMASTFSQLGLANP